VEPFIRVKDKGNSEFRMENVGDGSPLIRGDRGVNPPSPLYQRGTYKEGQS